ncbi:hypothetical protein C8R44DRAFT_749495 [Mycena epipterygia]|nr:hypothetical protein C8R44DRAFT_749495 [Mycena epipterygia]
MAPQHGGIHKFIIFPLNVILPAKTLVNNSETYVEVSRNVGLLPVPIVGQMDYLSLLVVLFVPMSSCGSHKCVERLWGHGGAGSTQYQTSPWHGIERLLKFFSSGANGVGFESRPARAGHPELHVVQVVDIQLTRNGSYCDAKELPTTFLRQWVPQWGR